ncbi:polyprenyl synthetase family protein [Aldersonia kunmingensis]|uniref:polyprenyl synthetase family protein n=1 Tax=Aldersonia kunmingensis TaxID=408066 RepID=UPI0008331046|nr:polyprenyl synthetase family protein [Aldersonia kunmingensis]
MAACVADDIAAVDAALRNHVHGHTQRLTGIHSDIIPVADYLNGALTGGKRLRALFCLWGARGATGGDLPAGALKTAAAIELFHLAALIHDDVMDHSDQRRGMPTAHRHFADRLITDRLAGDAEAFGQAVAILAGDLCLTWSDDLISEAVHARSPSVRDRTRAVWSTMRDETVAGQFLDILGQTLPSVSTARTRIVLHFKSAKYTVAHPLRLGGALAGASDDLLVAYESLGLVAGEAFQLRDDLLGVVGDPKQTGKPVIDDVREGKRTLLVAVATERARGAQLAEIERSLGNPDLTDDGFHAVCDIFRETGAVDHVERRIDELAAEAMRAVDALPVDGDSRTVLRQLVSRCVWRIS